MIPKEDKVRAVIAEQASEWFVADDAGPLDARKSSSLADWLRASPMHVEDFLGVAVIARDLRELGTDPEYCVETLLARAHGEDDSFVQPFWSRLFDNAWDLPTRRWRWQAPAVVIAAIAALTLGLIGVRTLWHSAPVPAPVEATALHVETRHGEQQTHRLADNSVLHLNTDTAVTIRYSNTERLVVLMSGEADFEVTHEPRRRFRVLAGAAEVVDLGTKFDVHLGRDSTVVTVAEGQVAVGLATVHGKGDMQSDQRPTPRFVSLAANQQISVTAATWPATPTSVDAQRTTSWLHRQISFDREPLERVAAEFNRYAPKPVEITTPQLRELEISGVFSTDDTEEFIAFLRSLEGVRVDITATRILVSQK